MMRRSSPFAVLLATVVMVSPRAAQADELKLKDGTKIIGTIVGFEENSFKVKTNYGFAVVQKDQVLSISITDSAKKSDAEKKSEPSADKPAPPAPAVNSYKKYNTTPTTPPPATPAADPNSPDPKASSSNTSSAASTAPATSKPATTTAPVNSAPAKAPTPTAAAQPPAAPAALAPPESMRERVSGNLYANETYGFQMYKPPTWQLVEGARSVLPGAITALGTSDQTTYLLIGRQPIEKSFASDIDATDRHLRSTLDNFRALGEKKIIVSGEPAVEKRFRVSVDQHDWSGVAVFFQHDAHLYTIFGMTSADSDLVQIQENVISRAISSLQFAKQ
ncbi:MAG TPA: hypothetical protein VGH17_01475 [Candidatus Acidoferrales bacterium]